MMTVEERLLIIAQRNALIESQTEPMSHIESIVTLDMFEQHCQPAADALEDRLSRYISCPQEYHLWWDSAWRLFLLRLGVTK